MKIIQVNGIMCLSTHNGRELKTKYVKKKSEIKSRYTNKQTQYVKKEKEKNSTSPYTRPELKPRHGNKYRTWNKGCEGVLQGREGHR